MGGEVPFCPMEAWAAQQGKGSSRELGKELCESVGGWMQRGLSKPPALAGARLGWLGSRRWHLSWCLGPSSPAWALVLLTAGLPLPEPAAGRGELGAGGLCGNHGGAGVAWVPLGVGCRVPVQRPNSPHPLPWFALPNRCLGLQLWKLFICSWLWLQEKGEAKSSWWGKGWEGKVFQGDEGHWCVASLCLSSSVMELPWVPLPQRAELGSLWESEGRQGLPRFCFGNTCG